MDKAGLSCRSKVVLQWFSSTLDWFQVSNPHITFFYSQPFRAENWSCSSFIPTQVSCGWCHSPACCKTNVRRTLHMPLLHLFLCVWLKIFFALVSFFLLNKVSFEWWNLVHCQGLLWEDLQAEVAISSPTLSQHWEQAETCVHVHTFGGIPLASKWNHLYSTWLSFYHIFISHFKWHLR